MKPAAFTLDQPSSAPQLAAMLMQRGESRIMAGGQSLGPMLNLRLARPSHVVSIASLPELVAVEETADAVTIGACVTHAAIADGRVPDIGKGILPAIAQGIAYRAVRNRGTIGGSLCHADPAADWLCTLTALDAAVLTLSSEGGRAIALTNFVVGPFRNALAPGEIVQAVRIPKISLNARWSYYKACRKPGEFAHAMAAVLLDPARNIRRAVIGAVGGAPIVLDGANLAPDIAERALMQSGLDEIGRGMQLTALRRAMEQAT
ncbi:FAD binding domain-containing protein [Pseudorhodoplanes sinuspersici]|uniref:Carbon monoxide dehydrogenase n=1 Tax=Pseudorhodoplanes sinuspersici TaxID=1235591 RepID=A0A1W6ZK45_9HYPH|nr:FAD binding domain-containing protein [Pseudorhodoplanes sinuspersici]ARP97709.1 carbon monoxide dehydrogenase [Pseudorhodoplanes sinuspersici]RKE68572.1 carbon-monoxide dehydrogenase medium subunit [Pseudorhodoplanes sinuspersici]